MTPSPSERLRLADDLHLTWDRYLLTVASLRWPPGIFQYDIEYLIAEILPKRSGFVVKLAARGQHIPFQVLRFDLDAEQAADLTALLERVAVYRDRLSTDPR